MNELNERVLPDDYPVHIGYYYVINDMPVRSLISGDVKDLKVQFQVDEIKNCDMTGRGLF